jgi:hypothetical protein
MRAPGELQEKIDHLIWYKQMLVSDFYVMDMTAKNHGIITAFCRTIDNEIAMLRWALGQVEETWTDDFSSADDIQQYYQQLPPTEFVHLPTGKSLSYWVEKGIVAPARPGPYVDTEFSPR